MDKLSISLFVIIAAVAIAGLVLGIMSYLKDDTTQSTDLSTLTVGGVEYPSTQGRVGETLNLVSNSQLKFSNTNAANVAYSGSSSAEAKLSATTVSGALDELDAAKLNASLLSAKGALATGTGNAPTALDGGSDGQVLTVDATAATGLAWKSPDLLNPAYYVSTTGSDSNDGSEESPFQTFQKAMETLETVVWTGTATVNLASGNYAQPAYAWSPNGSVRIEGNATPSPDFDGKVASGSQGGQPTFDSIVTQTAFVADTYVGKQIVLTQDAVVTKGIIYATQSGSNLISFINSFGAKTAYNTSTTFQVMDLNSTLTLGGGLSITGDVQFGSLNVTGGSIDSASFTGTELSAIALSGDLSFGVENGLGCSMSNGIAPSQNVEIFSSYFVRPDPASYVYTGSVRVLDSYIDSDVLFTTDEAAVGKLDNCYFRSTFTASGFLYINDCGFTTAVLKGLFGEVNGCTTTDQMTVLNNCNLSMNAAAFTETGNNTAMAVVNSSISVTGLFTFANTAPSTGVALLAENSIVDIGEITVSNNGTGVHLENSIFSQSGSSTFTSVTTQCYLISNNSSAVFKGFIITSSGSTNGVLLSYNSRAVFATAVPPLASITSQIKVGVKAYDTFANVCTSSAASTVASDFSETPSQFCSVSTV